VETLGGVSGDELVALYRRAAALVFPSLYEGFGLPPVEAMACGCPVAASNAASLPEVVGDAAVLFDPRDPGSIAAGIEEALARADELGSRGIGRAAAFTWDATARAHDRVYEAAVSA
jgi:glycosyltransferase involved in cell wall biosynthesis